MSGLYAIVDCDFLGERGVDPFAFAVQVLRGGPRMLQVRAKSAPARELLSLVERLLPECGAVPLIVNDRPDVAMLAGCAGVHVGQADLPVPEVRRLCARLVEPSGARRALQVGLSTHSMAQVAEGLALRPDYLAFGPIFPTSSKQGADPTVGLPQLQQASEWCRAQAMPLVAIGGISLERISLVAPWVTSVAVIGALWPGSLGGVADRVRTLCSLAASAAAASQTSVGGILREER